MFGTPRLLSLAFLLLVLLISSCSERACSVRLNKKKWKHYNSLQFGGAKNLKK